MNEKPDMMINIYGGNNLIAPVASSAIQNFYGDRGDEAYREYLNDREYSVYEAFKLVTVQNTIENFIDYLDRMKELNSPYIKILVGSRNENYNYLSEYIETIFSSKIYRGIKIIYKNKIYDFSLSERDV